MIGIINAPMAPDDRGRPAASSPGRTRLVALDSLRGLAALTVVFCHVMWLCKPDTPLEAFYRTGVGPTHGLERWAQWLGQLPMSFFIEITPLHLFVAGREAVILFYLLSGFVLYLAYQRGDGHRYRTFLTRRVCRIYLPYLAALALAVGLNATVSTGYLPEMNNWFNYTWRQPVNWLQALKHVSLVGSFDTDRFLMPSWTLVHEMRISILFPALVWLLQRGDRRLPGVVLGLSAAGIALDAALGSYGNYFITLHYAGFFLLGAAMAQHREWSMHVYERLSPTRRAAFLTAGLALYVFGRMVSKVTGLPPTVGDLPVGVGASCILLWSLSNPRVLQLAPVKWLGQVSYGLYLLHFSLLLASIYVLHAVLPLWLILGIGVGLSLGASALFFHFVEAPAIRLGRQLTMPAPRRPVPVRVTGAGHLAPPPERSW